MKIEGKCALVTGGANGIGFNLVRQFLKRGARCVVILDIDENGGNDAQKNLGAKFGKSRIFFFLCDVSKIEEFEESFKKALEVVRQLDIFVNNSGILNEDNWTRMVDVNFKGVVEGTKLALNHMGKLKSNEGGIIVNIASMAGLSGVRDKGRSKISVYCGTKHAIVGFSLAMKEVCDEKGIGLLIICPDLVDTNLVSTLASIYSEIMQPLFIKQAPEYVAISIIDLIEKEEKRPVWIISNNEPPFAIELPHFSLLKV